MRRRCPASGGRRSGYSNFASPIDALLAGATQQEMARRLFGRAVARDHWRLESPAYRSRIQRLVRRAHQRFADPLSGPWFD